MIRNPRHHIAWAPEMVQRAVALRQSGRSLREIGEAFHCSRGAIKMRLQKEGALATLRLRPMGSPSFRVWADLDIERLGRMLADGLGIPKIAAALNRTAGAVNSKARQLGLIGERRPTGGQGVVDAVRECQEVSRTARAVQGAYLACRASNDDDEPQEGPAATGATNVGYLRALLRLNEGRLKKAQGRLGVWSDMAERDLAGEIAQFVASIAAVRQAIEAHKGQAAPKGQPPPTS